MDEIEKNRKKEYDINLEHKEVSEKENRRKKLDEMQYNNRAQIEEHEKIKKSNMETFKGQVSNRRAEETDLRSILEREKEEERMRKEVYRRTLEQQKKIQEYNKG